jgi:AraC family transcriptional regulator
VNLPREQAVSPRLILSRMPPKGQSIVASSAMVGWEGVHVAILEGRIEEFFDLAAPFPVVMFLLKGAAQLEWRRGNRFSRLGAKPGDVLVAPPGDFNRLRCNLAIELLWCPIDPEVLHEIAGREWPPGSSTFEIVESFNRNDEELWNLGRHLADQVLAPIPGSRLYAQTLQTQIAIHLLRNYSSLPRPGGSDDGLADHRLRPVIDYIQQNLGDDVSLDTLAGIAGLSPNYFLGAFRQATGRTPHRYVTEIRIARACELLQDPRRPISEVSLAVGFSSQSHMTEVFRRTVKTTPAAYRRGILGLARNGDGAGP